MLHHKAAIFLCYLLLLTEAVYYLKPPGVEILIKSHISREKNGVYYGLCNAPEKWKHEPMHHCLSDKQEKWNCGAVASHQVMTFTFSWTPVVHSVVAGWHFNRRNKWWIQGNYAIYLVSCDYSAISARNAQSMKHAEFDQVETGKTEQQRVDMWAVDTGSLPFHGLSTEALLGWHCGGCAQGYSEYCPNTEQHKANKAAACTLMGSGSWKYL